MTDECLRGMELLPRRLRERRKPELLAWGARTERRIGYAAAGTGRRAAHRVYRLHVLSRGIRERLLRVNEGWYD